MSIKLFLLLLLSATAVLHSAEIDKSWQIFIPEKPTPTEQKAADEIAEYVEKISKIKLQVTHTASGAGKVI